MAISRKILVRVVIYGLALAIVGWQAFDRYSRQKEADEAAEKAAKEAPPKTQTIRLEDGTEVPILTPEQAAEMYGVEVPEAPSEPAEAPPTGGDPEKKVEVNPAVIGAEPSDRMR